jgi:hypothetical protein
LTKILIPRSDSISAKVIEPSDFEKLFSPEYCRNYVVSGLALSAGSGLAVNVATGSARLKGLHVENTASETVGSLTANTINYIYITISRDGNAEAQSWDFSKNTSGTTPTDSIFLGTATTGSSSVSAVSITNRVTTPNWNDFNDVDKDVYKLDHDEFWFGDGSDGDVVISSNTSNSTIKSYNNLTINAGQTLTFDGTKKKQTIRVRGTLTVSGTIEVNEQGGLGGGAGAGHSGGDSGSSSQYGGGGEDGSNGNPPYNANIAGGAGGGSATGGTNSGGQVNSGGGSGGTAQSNSSQVTAGLENFSNWEDARDLLFSQEIIYGSGGGGGAGAGGGSGNGGGDGGSGGNGGVGGGCLHIQARTIIINSGGVISSNGSNGSNGANGQNGGTHGTGGGSGGGSGGGGSGGFIGIIYETLTNNGSITVAGGTGGTAGTKGNGNGSGGNGNNGGTGTAGSAGIIKQLQI